MTDNKEKSIATKVKEMAKNHLTKNDDHLWASQLAKAITELADDPVEQDETEKLLIRLKREGFLSGAEFGTMLHKHLCEKLGE